MFTDTEDFELTPELIEALPLRVSTHHGGFALCVKSPQAQGVLFNSGLYDEEQETAWTRACEAWWTAAEELAQAHGFKGVWGAGRQGGWLLPLILDPYYGRPTPLTEVETYPEWCRFAGFVAELAELVTAAPGFVEVEVDFMLETRVERLTAEAERFERRARDLRAEVERLTA